MFYLDAWSLFSKEIVLFWFLLISSNHALHMEDLKSRKYSVCILTGTGSHTQTFLKLSGPSTPLTHTPRWWWLQVWSQYLWSCLRPDTSLSPLCVLWVLGSWSHDAPTPAWASAQPALSPAKQRLFRGEFWSVLLHWYSVLHIFTSI